MFEHNTTRELMSNSSVVPIRKDCHINWNKERQNNGVIAILRKIIIEDLKINLNRKW